MWIIIVFLYDRIIIFMNNTIYWLSGIFRGGAQPLYPTLHPLSASALARSPSTLAIGYFPIGGTHMLEAVVGNLSLLIFPALFPEEIYQ